MPTNLNIKIPGSLKLIIKLEIDKTELCQDTNKLKYSIQNKLNILENLKYKNIIKKTFKFNKGQRGKAYKSLLIKLLQFLRESFSRSKGHKGKGKFIKYNKEKLLMVAALKPDPVNSKSFNNCILKSVIELFIKKNMKNFAPLNLSLTKKIQSRGSLSLIKLNKNNLEKISSPKRSFHTCLISCKKIKPYELVNKNNFPISISAEKELEINEIRATPAYASPLASPSAFPSSSASPFGSASSSGSASPSPRLSVYRARARPRTRERDKKEDIYNKFSFYSFYCKGYATNLYYLSCNMNKFSHSQYIGAERDNNLFTSKPCIKAIVPYQEKYLVLFITNNFLLLFPIFKVLDRLLAPLHFNEYILNKISHVKFVYSALYNYSLVKLFLNLELEKNITIAKSKKKSMSISQDRQAGVLNLNSDAALNNVLMKKDAERNKPNISILPYNTYSEKLENLYEIVKGNLNLLDTPSPLLALQLSLAKGGLGGLEADQMEKIFNPEFEGKDLKTKKKK